MGSATGDTPEGGTSTAVRNTVAAGTGCGCLLSPVVLVGTVIVVIIIGGFGVLLAPLIALILLFSGGGSDSDNQATANQVIASVQGDGSGELDPATVPEDLVEPIEDAGELCGAIGPIVIASQIEKESGFDAAKVGPDGKQGISQLPPDIFEQYGEDDDDNDKTSALDAEDSIMAQGRYMCELAEQAQQMIDSGEVVQTGTTNSVLDLALAGYHLGMDAVRAAKGVPNTNDAQGYVLAVRAQFAKYEGIAAPPAGATPGVTPGSA
ncbi:transglycosylase SLT domain-containing protein [Streptomyces cinnabarinus]|uniref:Transglycosylase SLT domain-containing protein n=1 Tax=Streptomyces cinnabarinus TaxID=67287 RepID=A0ABY7KS46_9ACTN|nr:transglycosylase SLT domain-containing protein [Streptomyces cinnabarinus]WAZ25699.1 transglycosylase SLT domain-containing protein [Streptomyces cinnabarinus]